MNSLSDDDLFGLFDLKAPGKSTTETGLQKKNSKFLDMNPEEFELSISNFFGKLGYKLSVTQKTRDGGIDLDGHRDGLESARVVVQCKRYKGTVSVGAVRDLFGVVSAENNISQGFLVTTGKFSRDAIEFAQNKRITLIDGHELEGRSAHMAANSRTHALTRNTKTTEILSLGIQ